MTDVLSRDLPPPKNWQDFERLTFDVYGRRWKTSDAELHGRTGQPQSGVDVYGTDRLEGRFTGVQCKGKDANYGGALTERELRAEVAKALTFQPPLDVFVLATTAPNDVAIQKAARDITAEHRTTGAFEVRVTGWDTLRQYVSDFPDVLLKHFRDLAPVDPAGVFATSQERVAAGLRRLETQMLRSNHMLSEVRDGASGDPLAARITEVANLIGDGSPRAALKALRRLLADEGATASPLTRFRLLANMGNAEFALGNEGEAVSLFRQAHEAKPDHPNARATLAMAELATGHRERAFELATEALRDDPASLRAAGVAVDAAPDHVPLAELDAGLPPTVAAHAEIRLHLSLRAHRLGDEAAALRHAEEALAAAPDDWRTQSAVAEALIHQLSDVDGLAVTRALADDQRPAVERAIDLTRKAWETLAARDSSHVGRHVAANLTSLYELVGREDEAAEVLAEASAQNPDYGPLLYKSAQQAVGGADWPEVLRLLERVPHDQVTFDDRLLRAQAHIQLGHAEDAVKAASDLRAVAQEEDQIGFAEALAVEAAILAGADPAESRARALEQRPSSIVLRSLVFDMLSPDDLLRERVADEVERLAVGPVGVRARVHAAETLYGAGRYSLSADLFEPLHGLGDSFPLRRRLQALHLAGRRKEARALFESLPAQLRLTPRYVTIGVNIYEQAGLLKPALRLLEEVLRDRDELGDRLAWVQLLVRLGRARDMLDWLRSVGEDVSGTPEQLMALALMIDRNLPGDVRAPSLGYRSLRSGYSDPRIHLSYAIALFMNGNLGRAELRSPAVAGPGAGVILRNEASGEHLFLLIEADDPRAERGELSPVDPLARRLAGLARGDAVDINRVGIGPETHRVEQIQHRYVFALQRTFRDFTKLFPGHPAFGSFDMDESKGDERFEPMFRLARQRAEHGKELEDMYRSGVVPLLMLSRFAGASVFDLWEGMRGGPDGGIKVALGVDEEFVQGRAAASSGLVLVDPVTIYAWVRLGLASVLSGARDRLGVVQSSIDMLRQLLHEREERRGWRTGTFGWDGEHYQFVELSEDLIEHQIQDAAEAVRFAESLRLVPAEGDRPLRGDAGELIDDAHPAFHNTLIAALHDGRALLTDDLGFRVIAQESGAASTWTQVFLQTIVGRDGISLAEYRAAVDALISSNYEFTQFGHIEILAELRESGWVVNDRLGRMAALLARPTVSRASMVAVLTNVLVLSANDAPSPQALAAFHIAVAEKLAQADPRSNVEELYGSIVDAGSAFYLRVLNRRLLPKRLLASTSLISPAMLASPSRAAVKDHMRRLVAKLKVGGLTIIN